MRVDLCLGREFVNRRGGGGVDLAAMSGVSRVGAESKTMPAALFSQLCLQRALPDGLC